MSSVGKYQEGDGAAKAAFDRLRIGSLHLGTKTFLFEQAGYRTLGDIHEVAREQIIQIPSVGRRTVDELIRNRDALARSVQPDGEIDWQAYCDGIGIPLLPLGSRPSSGVEFLRCLSIFVDELADHLADGVLATILRDRICRPPSRQMTLEQIADLTTPKLSRERIRQKEKKLLSRITGGLLNDSYDGLNIHFHPDFSYWWKLAADALSGMDEIEVGAFVDLLCRVWDVPAEAVMQQLPAIVAIVTGEPQMATGFRSAAKADPKLFGGICEELSTLSVLKLRMGRTAIRLTEAGIRSVGDAITQLRSGELDLVGAATARHAAEHLNVIAGCICDGGVVNWTAYCRAVGLSCLPTEPPAMPANFVGSLYSVVEELLRIHQVTKRATEIFRCRTGRDARIRMTLQQTADELGTFFSTVKREETYFLGWLNDVLVAHEFWMIDVWLDAGWLAYWSEASDVFDDVDGDYERFADNLASRWRLTARDIRKAAPILWAVFSGYPGGRRSTHTTLPALFVAEAAPLGRIRLRGFRRLH